MSLERFMGLAKNGFEDEDDDEYENEGLCEGLETFMFT
jgi:hypothetical protein